MNCNYKKYCPIAGTSECNESCIRYKEMKFLLENSQIPEKRQSFMTLESVVDSRPYSILKKLGKNIAHHVNGGTNVVLYSEKTGNGKTSWAIHLMLCYFHQIWAGNGFKPRGYFLYVPDFINRVKQNIDKKDPELQEIMENIKDVDLLVLDDIGATKFSDYDLSILSSIIDQRVLRCKSTIYTTNKDKNGLSTAIGERMTDRIWNTAMVFHFSGESNRGTF